MFGLCQYPGSKWIFAIGVACMMGIPESHGVSSYIDPSDFSAHSLFSVEMAKVDEQSGMQKGDVVFQPELGWSMAPDFSLNGVLRFRGDTEDNLQPGEPDPDTLSTSTAPYYSGDHWEAEVREFYLDLQLDSAFVRVGKQQLVWGEADGIKLLDQLNPQSFREFTIPDPEQSRIPLWGINVETYLSSNSMLQWLWLPDKSYHDIPFQGDFRFTTPLVVPKRPVDVPVFFRSAQLPDRAIRDSDTGFKLTRFLSGWQFALHYLYHYRDRPQFEARVTEQGIIITPTYYRSHLLGASVNTVVGDFVIRGEIVNNSDMRFLLRDQSGGDLYGESDEFRYLIGIDWMGWSNSFISFQYNQNFIRESVATVRSRNEQNVTFLLRRKFANETIQYEVLNVHNLDLDDGYLKQRLNYLMTTRLQVFAGLDVFYGSEQGMYGQFKGLDRLLLGFDYSL